MIKFNLINGKKLNQLKEKGDNMTTKERTLIRFQDILDKVLPIAFVALMGWILLNSISLQKDVLAIRLQVAQVESHLSEHNEITKNDNKANAIIHHTTLVSKAACTGCHVQFEKLENADKARKLKN